MILFTDDVKIETGIKYTRMGFTNDVAADWSLKVAERVFMLTWSNTFGSDRIRSSRSRQTGAEEERRRLAD